MDDNGRVASTSRSRSVVLAELHQTQERLLALKHELDSLAANSPSPPSLDNESPCPLSLREYKRYGRQIILSSVALSGQLKLKHAKVLVIGAGGLGCPVLLYLAGAGVGEMTILDHDSVELSNLHRQVLHDERRIGMSKALSAALSLRKLNSDITVHAVHQSFTPSLFTSDTCPLSLLNGSFSLIIDCTDNPSTRHLINAYSIAHSIPLVSGGAVRTDGTVGVYGLNGGPCYACIFPPRSVSEPVGEEEWKRDERRALEGTGACADEGVLGILCGVVGLGMAAEAIKVLLGTAKPALYLYAPLSSTPYRIIKMRPRQPSCLTCSVPSKTLLSHFKTGSFPGWDDPSCSPVGVREREDDLRVSAKDWKLDEERVIDVRPSTEFDIVSLPGSTNIPLSRLLSNPSLALTEDEGHDRSLSLSFVCRRGNDSLLAARALRRHLEGRKASFEFEPKDVEIKDLRGGLVAWSRERDQAFPVY